MMFAVCHHVRMTTTATKAESWVPELTFGARLALIRHRMGWNVKEAAAACGLPAQSWRGWEIAGHLPRRYVEIAKQIAAATGVDYHWLVFGPDEGGGDQTPTRQYVQTPRVVATVGEARAPRSADVVDGLSPRRPVRRTRPLSAVRPATPVAL